MLHRPARMVLAAGLIFFGPGLRQSAAQGPTYNVTVLRDVSHGVLQRLSRVRPIPPARGLEHVMPLLLTHPAHPRRLQRDPVLQQTTSGIAQASLTSGAGFIGIGVGLGSFTDSYIPPDTNGAAGPTQYVQWVNASFAVFNKFTGAVEYGPAAGNTLWQSAGGACATYNSGDIIAQFDKQAGRWVMMQPVFTKPYYLCLAVSLTPDATGAYYVYQFPVPNNSHNFPDYPKLGVWPDGYYVSFNSFYNGSIYQGPTACVLDRAAMLSGQPASIGCAGPLGSSYSPILPADLDGDLSGVSGTTSAPPAEADYYLNFGTNSLNVWQFSSDHSTFSLLQTISVPSFSEACGGGACIPQAGTNQQLDSLGDRMMYRLAYRNLSGTETLVASQSVDTGSGNTGVRWYELQNSPSGWGAAQASTYDPSSNYRWMPSIAMDEAQDIALGYSVSSSGMNPAIFFTGHENGVDLTNDMEAETSIINGAGSQTSYNRWGDYSAMTVDPTDDCTLWYTNEYLKQNGNFNWSTQIAPIRFSNCPTLDLEAAPAGQTVTAGSSANYTLSVNPSGGSTVSTGFTVSGLPTGANATVGTISGAGSTTLTVSTSSSTPSGTYTLEISAAGGGITNVSAVVLTVSGSSTSGSFSLSSNPSSVSLTQGQSGSSTITVTPANGYTGTVNLTLAGCPSSATCTLSSSSVTITGTSSQSVTLNIGTTSSTPAGTYTLTITGTDSSNSSLTSSTSVSLTVSAASTGDFSIAASPSSETVSAGSSASYTVTTTALNGFTGTVVFSAGSLPPHSSATFSPTSVTGSGSSTMTVTTSRSTHKKTYTITITGASGSLAHSTQVSLTVQ